MKAMASAWRKMHYLQQDSATWEAELDAVLWSVVPREKLQVLD